MVAELSLITLFVAYSTSWGGVIRELQRKHENTHANVVFGLLAMSRGVGSLISGFAQWDFGE